MEKSQPHSTQDIDPRKPIGPEGLPKKVWNRLSDRSKLPRYLWFPPKRHLDLDADEWQRQHDDVSKSLRRTMMTLLGYSFFCMLTLAAPDVSLIARDAKINVPFAGTEVSYLAFLIIGPLTMFGLALYLHILLGHWLSLEKHKDTFGLPYIFNIDNKAANWLANFIFYWLPCFVLAFFSWKALPRPSEAFLLIIQTVIFFTCMVVLKVRRFPDDQHCFKFNALYLFGWLLGFCLLLGPQIGFYDRSLDLFRADLGKKDLRNTYLLKATLVEADLNGADLQKANLQGADLGGADLGGANLQGANLRGANLRGADLGGANLQGANLGGTDLSRTKGITSDQIFSANNFLFALYRKDMLEILMLPPDHNSRVKKKNFSGYNLERANLQGADLQGANLRGAHLRGADLREAVLWEANLWGANLGGADLREAFLGGADLRGANLRGAVLRGADLWEADLGGADLGGADLRGANLRGAKNLTVEQLCKASTLYGAVLETEIKQECPNLLKEPQENNPDEKK